jgi:hypothetical protein
VDVNRFSWVDDMNVLHYEYTLGEYVVAIIYSRKLGRSRVMILVVLVLEGASWEFRWWQIYVPLFSFTVSYPLTRRSSPIRCR